MKFPRIPAKKILLVLGISGTLISVYLFVAGGILLLTKNTPKDSDGFYATWNLQVERNCCAVVIVPESIEIQRGRNFGDWSTFKIEALNNDTSNRIFIGIAGKSDIDAYLAGVEYDETTDFHVFPGGVDFQNHPGVAAPGNPAAQTFWIESAHGAGTQILRWELEPDRNWLVLMNEDGNAGLDMNIVLGTENPLILIGGISNLSFGFLLLLISLLVLTMSARTRNIVFPEPLEHLRQNKMKVTDLIE